jgi:DNA-binding response OmpR family regulator
VVLPRWEAEVADRVRGMRTSADDYVGKLYDTLYVGARPGAGPRTAKALPRTARPCA